MALAQSGYADPVSQAQYLTQMQNFGRVNNLNGTGPGWEGTSYSGPGVSNDDINAWLAANPTANDSDIAAAMDAHGVSVFQMANATGKSPDEIYSRYAATKGTTGGGDMPSPPTTPAAQQGGGYYAPPGGGFSGVQGPSVDLLNYKQSPYLMQQIEGLRGQFNDNLNMNTLHALRGGAVATGGVGGSRQGIAEGLAAGQSNTGFANAATNLLGQDYTNAMNRNLTQYQADQNFGLGNAQIGLGYATQANNYDLGRRGLDLGNKNADNNYNLGMGGLALGNKNADYGYNLGLGNLALGNQNSMQNFYTQQRGQDLDSIRLGADLYGAGNSGEWSGIKSASDVYKPYTGYDSTTSTSSGPDYSRGVGNGLGAYQYLSGRNRGGGTDWGWTGSPEYF